MNDEVHKQQKRCRRVDADLLQHHGAACCLQSCFQFLRLFFGYVGPDLLREGLH